MEKLILHTGRYMPRPVGSTDERVRALEMHLAGLSGELEYLLSEIDHTLDRLERAISETPPAATAEGGETV